MECIPLAIFDPPSSISLTFYSPPLLGAPGPLLLGDEEAAEDAGDGFVGGGDGDLGPAWLGLKGFGHGGHHVDHVGHARRGALDGEPFHLGDLRFDEIAQPGHGVGDGALAASSSADWDGHVELTPRRRG